MALAQTVAEHSKDSDVTTLQMGIKAGNEAIELLEKYFPASRRERGMLLVYVIRCWCILRSRGVLNKQELESNYYVS